MKSKSLVLLAVAAGCGLVAMLGVQQMLSGGKTAQPKSRILVAKVDIDPGIPLDKTNVGFKEWPQDAMPQGAITKEEEFAERALKHRVVPGQPILQSELGNKGEFGLEMQIPDGMRVVSIPVTATMTHSGLLKPGNCVDVSAAIEYPQKGGGKRVEVKTVLQCIQVFAVGDKVVGSEESSDPKAKDAKDAKNVSFVVYPLQGQLLQLANKKSNGALQFALRSKSDRSAANTGDLTEQSLSMLSNQLFGEIEAPEPVKATALKVSTASKPKTSSFTDFVRQATNPAVTEVGDKATRRTWKIEVFNGDKREVQEIDWPEEPGVHASPSSAGSRKGWSNPLMKLFSGSTKTEQQIDSKGSDSQTDDAVEPRPSSLIRRQPEEAPPVDKPSSDETPPANSEDLEARNWLNSSGNAAALASERFETTAEAVKFVDDLYAAGAESVSVSLGTIRTSEGEPYASALRITLPKDQAQREQVNRLVHRELRQMGLEPEIDLEQNLLQLSWE